MSLTMTLENAEFGTLHVVVEFCSEPYFFVRDKYIIVIDVQTIKRSVHSLDEPCLTGNDAAESFASDILFKEDKS